MKKIIITISIILVAFAIFFFGNRYTTTFQTPIIIELRPEYIELDKFDEDITYLKQNNPSVWAMLDAEDQ